MGAWLSNPWRSMMLDPWLHVWERNEPPFPQWTYSPRAPSAWELSQLEVNAVLSSKVWTGPPALSTGEADCELEGANPLSRILARHVTPGCAVRSIEWGSECPLHVGGKLKCWFLSAGSDAAPGKYHGCGHEDLTDSRPPTLSTATDLLAGAGPPNRYCMTIFPPEWRVHDWYVATWLQELADFDPRGLLIAGVVLPFVAACAIYTRTH
eukprot:5706061-Prymnesium_polylepis.2